MKEKFLFQTSKGGFITRDDFSAALERVLTPDCQVIYMHSGLSFGLPNPELRRADLLQVLYETILELGVPTLCVPTFTFSFCNGEDYDVEKSKSHMGALNEHIRRQPEAIRSVDPLMSVAVVGKERDLAENLGHQSIGTNSTFDKLSCKKGVQFLFLGVDIGDCFTYMHYLEWMAKVPYRYVREFTGKISHAGKTWEDTYTLFVRYRNVKPNLGSYSYGQILRKRGLLRSVSVGDSAIGCVNESDARQVYFELLRENPDYFIEQAFSVQMPDSTFAVHNMIAL